MVSNIWFWFGGRQGGSDGNPYGVLDPVVGCYRPHHDIVIPPVVAFPAESPTQSILRSGFFLGFRGLGFQGSV
jgi:hypothetical protein